MRIFQSISSHTRCVLSISQRLFCNSIPFPRICLVGAPGSGKGTVSKYLMNEFDLHTISTGDILRSHIEEKTALGTQVKDIMDQGGLVPDDVMMQIIREEVQKKEHNKGWILDGIPRTEAQAISIDRLLQSLSMPLNAVYFIDVPEKEIVARISGRLVHRTSGRTYHVDYNPPKVPGLDDETGETLEQRDDDKPETVIDRLHAFQSKTKPVLDFFKEKSILETISATTSDQAFAMIKPKIQAILKIHLRQ